MKKLLVTTVAFIALFSGAAFAGTPDYPGAIEPGTSRAWTPTASGIPYIMPFVSDRTAKRSQRGNDRPNGNNDR